MASRTSWPRRNLHRRAVIVERVGALGEWGLLKRYLPSLGRGLSRRVTVGPGDDAAVVTAGGGRWALTTDMLVEGVHFRREWTSGEDLGHKALAVNLSDLAAMGSVIPAFGMVSMGITPKTPVNYVDRFYRGLRALASEHGFSIVGGDTVRSGRLTVSVAALGRFRAGRRPLLRSGAEAGDVLMVTGSLGAAAAGLEALQGHRGQNATSSDRAYLTSRLLRPRPRLDMGRRLGESPGVHSLMDSSDGLWTSVRLLGQSSRVGVVVEVDRLPLSPALVRWAGPRRAHALALTGGEDYELVLTASPRAARRLEERRWARTVGRVVERRHGMRAFYQGRSWEVPHGFEHFDGASI
jgi:thiamine-monophosphate kinase